MWRPHRGLHLVEFHGDFWRQEIRLRGLSSGVVCLILIFLSVLAEHRPLTDRQTQAHSIYRTSIASRSKNKPPLYHSAVLITKHSICFSQYHTDDWSVNYTNIINNKNQQFYHPSAPFTQKICTLCFSTWFVRSTCVSSLHPNPLTLDSAVFAQYTHVPNRQILQHL